ncbi:MAG TPA: LUD domain-containing protein [Symbiobacteriaceae bacterium]|nr:LUD domain-containing protein [Symbiobacteriaceae bacterium]
MTEQEFLTQIAARLGRSEPLTQPPARPGHRRGMPNPVPKSQPELVEWFQFELSKVGVPSELIAAEAAGEAVAQAVAARCPARGLVLLWDDPDALRAKAPLEALGFETAVWPVDRWTAARAVAGVTSARWAIAETGSIALAHDAQRGRVVSLLPPVHVAVLPTSRILGTADAYFRAVALLGAEGGLPQALNLATGPSRTADIEMDLSIGVHGPGKVHVVLYEG